MPSSKVLVDMTKRIKSVVFTIKSIVTVSLQYKFRKNNLTLVKAEEENILIIIDKNKYNDLIMKHLDDSQHYIKVTSNCNLSLIHI